MNTATADTPSGLGTYLGIIRRRYRYLAIIGPACLLLAVYLAFTIPPEYESTATILIESSTVNKELVATTVPSLSNQQVEIVEGRVMKPDTLQTLVRTYDPYPDPKDRALSVADKAQRILEHTTLERVDPVTKKPDQDANAFSLHYRNPDPERASQVATLLAKMFLNYNQRTRQQAAREAAKFIASQARGVSDQMREIDAEIDKFKNQHGDALPEYTQRNESEIDRNQHDLDTVEQEILAAQEKESLMSVELSHTSPNLISDAGDMTDVATVRAKLAEAEQRYTPDHPEVKRLKSALAVLMKQSNWDHNGIVKGATNPAYLSTASQLQSTRDQLKALHTEEARLRGQIDNYERMLRLTPGVEREYAEILRRRESLQTSYAQLQDKLQKAEVAENFETGDQGEKFTLLADPYPARLPAYPNRIGLILLGIFLGGILSAIAVAIAEAVDSSVRSARDFPELEDGPLLASIPRIDNSSDRRRRRVRLVAWAASYTIAVVFIGSVVIASLHLHK